MIERWRFRYGGTEHVPAWECSIFAAWSSWLFGVLVQRHPSEWSLELHLGPVMFQIYRVKPWKPWRP